MTGEKAHHQFKAGGIVSPVSRVRLRAGHYWYGRV